MQRDVDDVDWWRVVEEVDHVGEVGFDLVDWLVGLEDG